MRRALKLASLAVLAAIAVADTLHAQDGKGEPFELVRSLQSLQDQVVQGNARAHASQRALLARIAEQFETLPAERWQDPRNARAAVVFALSGGNPRVLHRLLRAAPGKGVDENLVKGALAYGEGRKDVALELLSGIDARLLDPSLAGHIAYIQGELAARKEPAKAAAHFDDARLLAPGTIVEEAALRRQIGILAAGGATERYEMLAGQYLRRFGQSVYASGFRRQFALAIAAHAKEDAPERLTRLEAMLRAVEVAERRDIYLSIAKEAVAKGRMAVARFAAAHAVQLADEQSPERERARTYEAAALIVTDDFQRGLDTLNAIDVGKLPEPDVALVKSALSIAAQIRRMPETPEAEPVAVADKRGADATVERARAAVARVDEILTKADRQ